MPIIPLEAHEPDSRDMLLYDIADTIGAALPDPTDIGFLDVADDHGAGRGEPDLS